MLEQDTFCDRKSHKPEFHGWLKQYKAVTARYSVLGKTWVWDRRLQLSTPMIVSQLMLY
jgi:hypothetical protein